DLSPAYFGLAMSTGIISIAAFLLGQSTIAHALFALNVVFYLALWALFLTRLVVFPHAMAADLMDHLRGPGFFTVVAATAVLGSQTLLLIGGIRIALGLWWFAVALWIGLIYAIFAVLTVKRSKPPLERGINGG